MSQYLKVLTSSMISFLFLLNPTAQKDEERDKIKSLCGVQQRACHTFSESYMSCMQSIHEESQVNMGTLTKENQLELLSPPVKANPNGFYE